MYQLAEPLKIYFKITILQLNIIMQYYIKLNCICNVALSCSHNVMRTERLIENMYKKQKLRKTCF